MVNPVAIADYAEQDFASWCFKRLRLSGTVHFPDRN